MTLDLNKNNCVHADSFRRYPIAYGGTGACKNVKNNKGGINYDN